MPVNMDIGASVNRKVSRAKPATSGFGIIHCNRNKIAQTAMGASNRAIPARFSLRALLAIFSFVIISMSFVSVVRHWELKVFSGFVRRRILGRQIRLRGRLRIVGRLRK